MPLGERLRHAVLKPAPEPGEPTAPVASPTVEELRETVRRADDKERLIGLLAAPVSAAVGILVITALVDDDPPARLANGALNTSHVDPSTYHALVVVLLGLSLVMLATALWRKRLYLGIVMALFGLAIFNLHYWGFGIPFILGAAWYLVRAFRFQRDLKEATAADASSPAPVAGAPGKRYTPPRSAGQRRPGQRRSGGGAGAKRVG